jgi:hypothetical protein
MTNLEDRIRERAYKLWERAGCPDGRNWEFWFAARREIEAVGAKNAKGSKPVDPFEPPIAEPTAHRSPGRIVEPAGRS